MTPTTSPYRCHTAVPTPSWYPSPQRWVGPVLSVTPTISPDRYYTALPTLCWYPSPHNTVSQPYAVTVWPHHLTKLLPPCRTHPLLIPIAPEVSQSCAVCDPCHLTRPFSRCHTHCWYLPPHSTEVSQPSATSPDRYHIAIHVSTLSWYPPPHSTQYKGESTQCCQWPPPPHQTTATLLYPHCQYPSPGITEVSQPCAFITVSVTHLPLTKLLPHSALPTLCWYPSPHSTEVSQPCFHNWVSANHLPTTKLLPYPPSVDTHHPTIHRWVSPVFITGSVTTPLPHHKLLPYPPSVDTITPQYTGESALFSLLGQWQPPPPPPPPPQTAALPTLCWYHHPTVHGWVSPVLSQCHWLHHLITTVFSYSPHPTPHWHPSGDLSPHSKDVTVLLLHFCCRVPH